MTRTLYVSDLDFTLLRSDARLGPETVRIVNDLVDAGGLFTFATARSFDSARRVTAELRLALPAITSGGTVLVRADAPAEVLFLPDGVAAAVESLTARGGPQPILHTFADRRDGLRWHPERADAGVRRFLGARSGDRRLRPISDADPLDPRTVFYVSLLGDRDALAAVRDALAPALVDCAVFLSEDPGAPGVWWLEFHAAGGTKAHAVRRLAVETGADRVVVFGDNLNDIPMFQVADEAYAVANAVEPLRRIATGVIGSNDEDGVARWIATDRAGRCDRDSGRSAGRPGARGASRVCP